MPFILCHKYMGVGDWDNTKQTSRWKKKIETIFKFKSKGANEKSSIWSVHCSDCIQIDRKFFVGSFMVWRVKKQYRSTAIWIETLCVCVWMHISQNSKNGGVNKLYLFVHRTEQFFSHELSFVGFLWSVTFWYINKHVNSSAAG